MEAILFCQNTTASDGLGFSAAHQEQSGDEDGLVLC